MQTNKLSVLILISALFITGCATNKEIYYWGDYEQLIYNSYTKPGSADSTTQIERLNRDIQKAESKGKQVPPGIYAHLAFLYALEGKDSQSQSAFEQEKNLYPESAVFIDGLLRRAKQHKENQL